MAELLIRICDKPGLHPANRIIATAGDVIAIQPDGWPWGKKELDNPEWRIWRLTGIEPERILDLCEVDNNRIAGSSFYVRKRVRYLDLTGALARTLIAAGSFISLTEEETRQVLALKRTKPALGVVG